MFHTAYILLRKASEIGRNICDLIYNNLSTYVSTQTQHLQPLQHKWSFEQN